MTNVVGISFNPLQNKQNNFNLWFGGRVGAGIGDPSIDHIQNIVGAEVEFEYLMDEKFSLFGGLNINRASIKDFDETISPQDSVSIIDGAGLFELFADLRYYFHTPKANSKIGVSLKGGMNFWNGIADFENSTSKFDSDDYYVGLGVSITSLKPLGRIGTPILIAPETEFNYSPILSSITAKLSQPVRFLDGFSAAVTGNIGYGMGHPVMYYVNKELTENLNNSVGKFAGIGVDLRFFDYKLNSYVNPYIGWNINFYDFEDANIPGVINPKYANFISLGNKIRIANSNWFINLKASVALWDQISNYQRDSLGLTMSYPSPIDINVGIGYKFNFRREKSVKNHSASYKIYDVKDFEELAELSLEESEEYETLNEEAKLKPLSLDEKADSLFEERIYLKENPVVNITKKEVINFPNWDVSDIKFFRVSFRFALEMNLFAPDLFDEVNPPAESTEILVAMFNKNRCDVDKLTDLNMYLHFNDLDSSRYFGYRYDEYRQLQPETKDLIGIQRDANAGPVYYGKHDDFVKQLKWIDDNNFELQGLTFPGNKIQDNAFRQFTFDQSNYGKNQVSEPNQEEVEVNSENYRLAYVIYPRETLMEVQNACDNFGVSIMFRNDLDKDMDTQNPLSGHFDEGQFIDKNDAAFFSNTVHGSKIYDPEKDGCRTTIQLTDFKLGSAELIPSIHYPQLQKAAELANLCNISIFIGFTDSVEFNNPSSSMDKFISDFTNINFENQLISDEFDKIVNEWTKFEAGETNLSSNEISQKALAFRRINSVVDALKRASELILN